MEAEMKNGKKSNKRPRKPNSRFLNDSYVHDVPKRSKGDANVENDELSSESLTEGNDGDVTIDNGAITSQHVSVQQTDHSLVESSTQQMNNSDGNGKNGAEIITEPESIAQQVVKLAADFKKMQKQRAEDEEKRKADAARIEKLEAQREEDAARIETLVAEVDKLKNQKKCGNCNQICTPDTEVWCQKCRKEDLHKKGEDLSKQFVDMGKAFYATQLEVIADKAMLAVYHPPTPPSEQTVEEDGINGS